MIEEIKRLAESLHPRITGFRRHLHANPELSFQEFKSQQFIEEQLDALGVTDHQRMAGTGVVALVKGRNPDSRVIALRADMDALPIMEANDKVSYY